MALHCWRPAINIHKIYPFCKNYDPTNLVPGIQRLHLLPALTSSLAPKMQGRAPSEKRTFRAFQRPPGLCHWLHSNGSSLKLSIGSDVVELENPDGGWPYWFHRYLSHFCTYLNPKVYHVQWEEILGIRCAFIGSAHRCLRWVVYHGCVEGWVTQWVSGGMLNPAVSD